MEVVEAIISLAIAVLEIVLIVKLFICFKQVKNLTIETANIRSYIRDIHLKNDRELKELNKKIDNMLDIINQRDREDKR